MELGLQDKVAMVTGASKGIGRAIALELAAEGMDVAVVARDEGKLRDLARELEAKGRRCLVLAADLMDETVAGEFVAAARGAFRKIDLVVNNAGATKRGDFLELTERDWADGFGLKFFGAVRMCRAAWGDLCKSRGTIVNIVGVGGRTGSADFTIGGTVNAAVLNLTKALADRGIRDGVRVNAINPGWIETDRLKGRVQKAAREYGVPEEEAGVRLAKEIGVARFGRAEEIAAMVAFLASGRAGYVQGAVIDVDGGMTRTL